MKTINYLNVVVPVVVQVEHSVNFAIRKNVKIVRTLGAFTNSLLSIFLHLNVVELSTKRGETQINKLAFESIDFGVSSPVHECTFSWPLITMYLLEPNNSVSSESIVYRCAPLSMNSLLSLANACG